MFVHIFTTRLKCLLRDRGTIFWTMMFPIVLALLFNATLRNIDARAEGFQPVSIAVINDAAYAEDTPFQKALEAASTGDDRIFSLTLVTREEAESLLEAGTVSGYYAAGDPISVTAGSSGFEASLMKTFADSYTQTRYAANDILEKDPRSYEKLAAAVSEQTDYLRDAAVSDAEPDSSYSYFYSLLAMACLYAGFWGLREVEDIQADLSDRAARVNIAPVKKGKAFFSSMAASFVISMSEILLLFAFLRFALAIDFGVRTGLVLLTTLVGCLIGLSGGAFIGAVVKGSENLKTGVMLGLTMTGCVFAGMMYQEIKMLIEKNAPFVKWINPVNLLSDAYYSIYYLPTLERFWLDIAVLGAFIAVFRAGTYFTVRRRRYANL